MKRIILLIASILPFVACNKMPGNDPLHTDNSFELEVRASYATDYLRNSLHVSLKKGIEGEYSCSLLIDGGKVSGTEIINLGSFTSGDGVDLHLSSELTFILPVLTDGAHVASLTFTREGISRTVDVEYEQKPPITARPEITEDSCQLVLESTGMVGSCTVSIYVDGENVSEIIRDGAEVSCPITADFSKTSYMILTFPSDISTGSHVVTVIVRTSKGSYETMVNFYKDYANVISVTTLYRADQLCNAVQVKLEEGADRPYTVEYLIDNDPTLKVRSSSGYNVDSGFGVTLLKNAPVIYLLPRLSAGTHTATFRFTSEGVTSEYNIRFEEFPPFSIEISDKDTATPGLTIRADDRVTGVFNIQFRLNDKDYEAMNSNGVTVGSLCSFDFTTQKEADYRFSAMEPGEYNVSVTLTNESGATDVRNEFFSITKDYVLKIVLGVDNTDDNNVRIFYYSPNNEFKESVRVAILYDFDWTLKYRHTQAIETNTDQSVVTNHSRRFERTDTVRITPGTKRQILPIDRLDEFMDDIHVSNHATHQWRWPFFNPKIVRTEFYAYINSIDMTLMFFVSDPSKAGRSPIKIEFEPLSPYKHLQYPYFYQYITWFTSSIDPLTEGVYSCSSELRKLVDYDIDLTITSPQTQQSHRSKYFNFSQEYELTL